MGLVIGVVSAAIAIVFIEGNSWMFWLLWIFAGLNLYGWWYGGRR